MKKGKIASLLLATAIAATTLTGCTMTEERTIAEPSAIASSSSEYVVSMPEKPESITYQPYEHIFMKRIYMDVYSENVSGIQLQAPEGYEVLIIQNFNETKYKSSQTGGFDVWFVNTQTVEVEPVYNETFKYYDYSSPGIVIEQELADEVSTLTLTR